MRNNQDPNRGFTLIETIIYIALFSLVMGGLLIATYEIIQNTGKDQNRVDIQEEGNFLLGKIEWGLSGATAITVTAPSTLSITKASLVGTGQDPLVFSVNGQYLDIQRGTGVATPLNSGSVTIASTTFTDIAASGTQPEGVKIDITLVSETETQSFEAIKYLRK